MPVTMEQVRQALNPDEPRYKEAASLGPEALPHLKALIEGESASGLAAKAAYLASLIEAPGAADVVERAARSVDPVVRAAAASALSNLPLEDCESVSLSLVRDGDVGVRKTALAGLTRSAQKMPESELVGQLARMADDEPETRLRELSAEAANRLRGA